MHEAKLKQKVIQVKEVKFRPGTDDGDYGVKLRNLSAFWKMAIRQRLRCGFGVVKWPTKKSESECWSV
jgi:translation initiation factor IF-3